ncbi:hypothetical protein VP01_2868g2 [Puccinia sorghi]|uniref:Uncharacterized protein n=1 Tax=Puccinia sorghi TaxID=27349 RepID=A0A0L6V1V6_9BASI|nr:hypothetical protein VP01_2868g2 [Puccinia sorghi]
MSLTFSLRMNLCQASVRKDKREVISCFIPHIGTARKASGQQQPAPTSAKNRTEERRNDQKIFQIITRAADNKPHHWSVARKPSEIKLIQKEVMDQLKSCVVPVAFQPAPFAVAQAAILRILL